MSCPLHSGDWSCAGCVKVRLEKGNALLTKKLAGLEDIDEVSAGYRDIAAKAIDLLEKDHHFHAADKLQKEFDEVGE